MQSGHLVNENACSVYAYLLFIGGRSRKVIWTKTACPDIATFSKFVCVWKNFFEFWKGFGCDLEKSNIWLFGYLKR